LLNVPSEKFNGNFIMFDSTSPLSEQSKANYKEFGNRFKLYYLSQSEIEAS
jgi:hypothetical protein